MQAGPEQAEKCGANNQGYKENLAPHSFTKGCQRHQCDDVQDARSTRKLGWPGALIAIGSRSFDSFDIGGLIAHCPESGPIIFRNSSSRLVRRGTTENILVPPSTRKRTTSGKQFSLGTRRCSLCWLCATTARPSILLISASDAGLIPDA